MRNTKICKKMASGLSPSGRVSTSYFPFALGLFILYLLKVKHKNIKKMASRLGPKGRVSTPRFPFVLVLCILYVLKVKHKNT